MSEDLRDLPQRLNNLQRAHSLLHLGGDARFLQLYLKNQWHDPTQPYQSQGSLALHQLQIFMILRAFIDAVESGARLGVIIVVITVEMRRELPF